MEISILDNGTKISQMVKVKEFGLMEMYTKVIGAWDKEKVLDVFGIKMVQFTKEVL